MNVKVKFHFNCYSQNLFHLFFPTIVHKLIQRFTNDISSHLISRSYLQTIIFLFPMFFLVFSEQSQEGCSIVRKFTNISALLEKKMLIKQILKCNCPSFQPCGTLLFIYAQVLNVVLVLTFYFLFFINNFVKTIRLV